MLSEHKLFGVLIQLGSVCLNKNTQMEKVFTVFYDLHEMNFEKKKKYLSDRINVTLFQLTLLDGLKSVLESIKKNHSKVKGKCENFSKI